MDLEAAPQSGTIDDAILRTPSSGSGPTSGLMERKDCAKLAYGRCVGLSALFSRGLGGSFIEEFLTQIRLRAGAEDEQ
jgi:hypothetical protein